MLVKVPQEFYAKRTARENIAGIVETYRQTGRIGKTKPDNEKHAKDIARKISFSTRRRAKETGG
jgi:hypothetical protein